eukprot:SAG22_NODE_424_length_10663_cov_93.402026_21_plen_91_part_00
MCQTEQAIRPDQEGQGRFGGITPRHQRRPSTIPEGQGIFGAQTQDGSRSPGGTRARSGTASTSTSTSSSIGGVSFSAERSSTGTGLDEDT